MQRCCFVVSVGQLKVVEVVTVNEMKFGLNVARTLGDGCALKSSLLSARIEAAYARSRDAAEVTSRLSVCRAIQLLRERRTKNIDASLRVIIRQQLF